MNPWIKLIIVINTKTSFSEILQFVNRLNGKIPIDDLLARSESLLVQIQNCISTPPVVKQLLDI